jgi:hypothetical protein
MKTLKAFEILKGRHGTHKAAADYLEVSYSRYNDWRWHPEKMPGRARKLVELAAQAKPTAAAQQ